MKKRRASSVLGLSLDGNRLEGVELRRTNGSLEVGKAFSFALTLDPLTNDAELVGQEIRNHLDAAGIRERRCAVCVPLNWALTLQTKIPELPEADIASFLQIEAERGFPYGPEALLLANTIYRLPGGERQATQVALPRDHVTRLEKALVAAKLKPVAISLGVTTLQSPGQDAAHGVVALAMGASSVGLQVSFGGGIAALRILEGASESEDDEQSLFAEAVTRELRITLGQLPAEVREAVRRVRIFGADAAQRELAQEIRRRAESMGMNVELVTSYAANEFGAGLPANTAVSPALSLAARQLVAGGAALDFLPPKISAWQEFTGRYGTRKLAPIGAAAGFVALVVIILFLAQQWQLAGLRSQWSAMSLQVKELDDLQRQIKRFRPWFDESFASLSMLRRLTEAFPEDSTVVAKSIEIRDAGLVTCTGTTRDSKVLVKVVERLNSAPGVVDAQVTGLTGTSPSQFTLSFRWGAAKEL
ncbi:MAG: hypothetical protein HY043_11975 [Verrucomicrobia bacterium]|nr:hypothetical protein [Verrucomicrobiota bacterium]